MSYEQRFAQSVSRPRVPCRSSSPSGLRPSMNPFWPEPRYVMPTYATKAGRTRRIQNSSRSWRRGWNALSRHDHTVPERRHSQGRGMQRHACLHDSIWRRFPIALSACRNLLRRNVPAVMVQNGRPKSPYVPTGGECIRSSTRLIDPSGFQNECARILDMPFRICRSVWTLLSTAAGGENPARRMSTKCRLWSPAKA